MDKKVTTVAGIALGASLLAGAGFAIYKYFSKKENSTELFGARADGNRLLSFVGNGLFKSTNLYDSQSLYGDTVDDGLVGGGLYKKGY